MISYDSPLKILDMEINFFSQMMMAHDILRILLGVWKNDVADVIFKKEYWRKWRRRRRAQ